MARIAGIDLPKNKRSVVGLTYIYGIGKTNAHKILTAAGIPDDAPVLLGGSLHPGEDDALLDAFVALRAHHPTLVLVLVPRIVSDAPRATEAARNRGLRVATHSARHRQDSEGAEVLVTANMADFERLAVEKSPRIVGLDATLESVLGRTRK